MIRSLFLILVAAAILSLGWIKISIPDSAKNKVMFMYHLLKVSD